MATQNRFGINSYGAKADEDMINANAVIPVHIGTPRGGIFWCEQAIEKYFKHLLVGTNDAQMLSMRHKLLPLASEVGFRCSQEERYILRELGAMYYERYPVEEGEELPEDPTWEEAERILALAQKVQGWAYSIADSRVKKTKESLSQWNLFE